MSPGPHMPIAEAWFEITEVEPGIFKIVEPYAARLMRANLWLIQGRDRDLLIDTGVGVASLRRAIGHLVSKPLVLFTTHVHLDHTGGHAEFADLPESGGEILVHPAEARLLTDPWPRLSLAWSSFSERDRADLAAAGFVTEGWFIEALPHPGFDPAAWRWQGVEPTRLIDEGEVVDLGDRRLRVLHLPGHSPGCSALLDERDGTFFAGDAIYDGIIVDTTPFAHIPSYLRTMRRLRDLPVRIVHAGHKPSFGQARMVEIVDAYLASRGG